METGKRPKGCYNCTKRRIICDRTEPQCVKCAKKSLVCPGMGIRYRFNDGIAARGKFRGQDPFTEAAASSSKENNVGAGAPVAIKWVGATRKDLKQRFRAGKNRQVDLIEDTSLRGAPDDADSVEEISRTVVTPQNVMSILPALELLDPQTRYLFQHFNQYVSPVMLLFDDETNGYRHQILPFAFGDDVVQRAVSVAAAFHLSARVPELRAPAEAGRAVIIKKLKDASWSGSQQVFNESTWTTILLLIVADLITGSEDMVILYNMLMSFIKAKCVDPNPSPLVKFLLSQSQLIEYFALPIVDESRSVANLGEHTSPVVPFDDMQLEKAMKPGSYFKIPLYAKAYSLARDVYLHRARSSTDDLKYTETTESSTIFFELKHLLVGLDQTAAGAHTMVWPYFVGAAESSTAEDREFFHKRLEYICHTTGYDNVRVALDVLEQLWAHPGTERWTALLPKISSTIIM